MRSAAGVVSILIDRTDRLTELQLQAIKQEVSHLAEEVPIHGAFRVYEVGVGGALLTPVVNVYCGSGFRIAPSLPNDYAMFKFRLPPQVGRQPGDKANSKPDIGEGPA
jgi:hypothetical protein